MLFILSKNNLCFFLSVEQRRTQLKSLNSQIKQETSKVRLVTICLVFGFCTPSALGWTRTGRSCFCTGPHQRSFNLPHPFSPIPCLQNLKAPGGDEDRYFNHQKKNHEKVRIRPGNPIDGPQSWCLWSQCLAYIPTATATSNPVCAGHLHKDTHECSQSFRVCFM